MLKACARVGIDVTKRCNVKCRTCFYFHKADFNSDWHESLGVVMAKVEAAKKRGCDHAVLVGYGEPTLWPSLMDWISECKKIDISTSIITNGTSPVGVYDEAYVKGLNHLHVSVHGVGKVLDDIFGVKEGWGSSRQQDLMQWLSNTGFPWRSNTTLQQLNHAQLPTITRHLLDHGCRHIVYLGFLPHYEWGDPNKLRTVAVHPAEMNKTLETCIDMIETNNADVGNTTMLTVRYQPMCLFQEKYRKYVTNALYVPVDSGEWVYGEAYPNSGWDTVWNECQSIGNAVSIKTAPCAKCGLKMHCGGWNATMAKGFDGAGLVQQPMDDHSAEIGYYFMQNPFNQKFKGWF